VGWHGMALHHHLVIDADAITKKVLVYVKQNKGKQPKQIIIICIISPGPLGDPPGLISRVDDQYSRDDQSETNWVNLLLNDVRVDVRVMEKIHTYSTTRKGLWVWYRELVTTYV